MSAKYEMVKDFYDRGLWDINRVKNIVTAPVPLITKQEYQQITGFVYPDTV